MFCGFHFWCWLFRLKLEKCFFFLCLCPPDCVHAGADGGPGAGGGGAEVSAERSVGRGALRPLRRAHQSGAAGLPLIPSRFTTESSKTIKQRSSTRLETRGRLRSRRGSREKGGASFSLESGTRRLTCPGGVWGLWCRRDGSKGQPCIACSHLAKRRTRTFLGGLPRHAFQSLCTFFVVIIPLFMGIFHRGFCFSARLMADYNQRVCTR